MSLSGGMLSRWLIIFRFACLYGLDPNASFSLILSFELRPNHFTITFSSTKGDAFFSLPVCHPRPRMIDMMPSPFYTSLYKEDPVYSYPWMFFAPTYIALAQVLEVVGCFSLFWNSVQLAIVNHVNLHILLWNCLSKACQTLLAKMIKIVCYSCMKW
jgi:hypothetical protein